MSTAEQPQPSVPKDAVTDRVEYYRKLVKEVGWPLVVVLGLVFWAKPYAETFIKKHFDFMDSSQATNKVIAEAVEKQAEAGEKQAENGATMSRTLQELKAQGAQTHDMVKDIHNRVKGPVVGHLEPMPEQDECK